MSFSNGFQISTITILYVLYVDIKSIYYYFFFTLLVGSHKKVGAGALLLHFSLRLLLAKLRNPSLCIWIVQLRVWWRSYTMRAAAAALTAECYIGAPTASHLAAREPHPGPPGV